MSAISNPPMTTLFFWPLVVMEFLGTQHLAGVASLVAGFRPESEWLFMAFFP